MATDALNVAPPTVCSILFALNLGDLLKATNFQFHLLDR